MGSLLGGSNKSSQSQTSTGQGTSVGVQGSKSSSTGVSNSSSFSKSGLSAAEVLSQWEAGKQGTDQWSKTAALSDVQGVLRQQATDALQSVMPSIAKTETTAGAYNSTTRDLLRNDASARITQQLSKTALDAITSYGQLGNQTTANNNALLAGLGGVAKDTGSSGSTSSSTNISDSSSFGQTASQQTTESSGSGGSKGGSGLLGLFGGLFADGGEVPEAADKTDWMETFMDMSGINKAIMDFEDLTKAGGKLLQGDVSGASKDAANAATKAEQDDIKLVQKLLAGFADGGQVPGGEEPAAPKNTMVPAEEILAVMAKYANGGVVRSGEEDVKTGGKIKGKQSATGEDNQVIAVAGGEGIIPKDVMAVPGVSQFLENLIAQYHKPVKG
jgi:hypothetical protein